MNEKTRTRLALFSYYVQERARLQAQYTKTGGRPASEDPIFSSHRFPGIIRSADKTSHWLWESWYLPYKNHHRLWFSVILARTFNLPRTLSVLGFPGQEDPKQWREHALGVLAFLRDCRAPAFSTAYTISPMGHRGDKAQAIVHESLYPALVYFSQENTFSQRMPLQKIWEILMLHLGLGPVVCHEIACDFVWTKYYAKLSDAHRWGFVSPPALDALGWIFDRRKIEQDEARLLARSLQKDVWPFPFISPLFVDMEHALVGFSRYVAAKTGHPPRKVSQ